VLFLLRAAPALVAAALPAPFAAEPALLAAEPAAFAAPVAPFFAVLAAVAALPAARRAWLVDAAFLPRVDDELLCWLRFRVAAAFFAAADRSAFVRCAT
jgi:hypothetical protein